MEIENLFDIVDNEEKEQKALKFAPLARRMRPETLDDIVGQQEAIGASSWLRCAIEQNCLPSIILYGPAGCGKTSLAYVIAKVSNAHFEEISAISGSVTDIRNAISSAKDRIIETETKTILFVDEIHRFSKSQQDCLLGAVEDRTIILIGATTENPYFEVNNALLSRLRVVMLSSLSNISIQKVLTSALKSKRGLNSEFKIDDEALDLISKKSGGDVRFALNTLELSSQNAKFNKRNIITCQDVESAMPNQAVLYDKGEDLHYDTISAFIKSMRGSDVDAAIYWMAKMLYCGEDPKFIARRIMICASEDVGNADPNALLIAHAAFKATEVIGMPECRINLAQAVAYICKAKKSNACEVAIDRALNEVKKSGNRAIPNNLRDRHRPGAEDYGEYKYPHNYKNSYVDQQYLPDELKDVRFYEPKCGWETDKHLQIDKN